MDPYCGAAWNILTWTTWRIPSELWLYRLQLYFCYNFGYSRNAPVIQVLGSNAIIRIIRKMLQVFHECGIAHTFAQRWVMPHSSNLRHEDDWFRTKKCGFQWYLGVVFCKTVIHRYTGTCYYATIQISLITVNTGYGDNAKHRPTVYSV